MTKQKRERKRAAKAAAAAEADQNAPAEPEEGLCPCALSIKLGDLERSISSEELQRAVCSACAGTAAKPAKGGKRTGKKKNAKASPDTTEEKLPLPAVCMTCGHCACLPERHCEAHAEACARSGGKAKRGVGHTLFLLAGDTGKIRGYCVKCQLYVAPRGARQVGEDGENWGSNDSYLPVDAKGYLFDEDGSVCEKYIQCASLIMKGLTSSGPLRGSAGLADNESDARNRRKGRRRSEGGTWEVAHVCGAARHAGLRGLPNLGNTCFFNAALQCLVSTPGIAEAVRQQTAVAGPLGAALQAFLLRVTSPEAGIVAQLRGLIEALRRKVPHFLPGEQQDAQEAVRFLFSGVEMEWSAKSSIAQRGSGGGGGAQQLECTDAAQEGNALWPLFGGRLGSVTVCGQCGQSTETGEICYDLSVPLSASVPAALAAFFFPEPLGEGSYLCSTCNKQAYEEHRLREEMRYAERLEAAEAEQRLAGDIDLDALVGQCDSDDDDDDDDDDGSEEEEEEEEGEEDDATPTPPATPSRSPAASPAQSPPARAGYSGGGGGRGRRSPQAPVAASDAAAVAEDVVAEERAPPPVYTTATKQYFLRKAPRILTVHLKRFVFSERTFTFVKDSSAVHVPPEIEVTETRDACSSRQVQYKLFAVVNHNGSVGGGHYTARVHREKGWFKCDDSSVLESGPPPTDNRDGYLLFYCQR